jgi:hypothetical protein
MNSSSSTEGGIIFERITNSDSLLMLARKAPNEYSFALRLVGLVKDLSVLFLKKNFLYVPIDDYHAPTHWPLKTASNTFPKVYTEGADRIDIAASYYSSTNSTLDSTPFPISRSHVYALVTPVNDEPHFSLNNNSDFISMRRLLKSIGSPYSSESPMSAYVRVNDLDEDSGDIANATISLLLNCSNSCGQKCIIRFDSARSSAIKIEVIDNNSNVVQMRGVPSQVNKALNNTFLTIYGFVPCPIFLNASMPLEYRTLHVSFDKETERGGDVDQDESFYPQAYVVSFVDLQSFGSTTISSEANVSVSLPPMHITTASKAIAVNESLNVIAEVSARMGEVSLHSISIPGVEFVTRYEQTIQSDPLADSECSNRLLISTRKIKSESCLSSLTLSGNLSSVNAALSDLLYKADIGMSSAAFGLERIEIRLLSLENFLERERAGIVTAGSLSSSRTFRFSVNIV